MDPGVPDLLGENRQSILDRQHFPGQTVQIRRAELGVRVLLFQFPVNLPDGLCRLRAVVVAGMGKIHGGFGAGDHGESAVIPVVHDHDLAALILPAEHVRHIRHSGGGVDADVQEFEARFGQIWHHGNGVTGHVRHFSADGFPAEPGVQVFGEAHAVFKQRAVHQFGVGGTGQAVPADVPGADRFFHFLLLFIGSGAQVVPDEEGAGGPKEAFLSAAFPQLPGCAQRAGDVFFPVLLKDCSGKIGKAHVQMGFE